MDVVARLNTATRAAALAAPAGSPQGREYAAARDALTESIEEGRRQAAARKPCPCERVEMIGSNGQPTGQRAVIYHQCLLPAPTVVTTRATAGGEPQVRQAWTLPDPREAIADARLLDDLALALHQRLWIECPPDEQERLTAMSWRGDDARAERESAVEWAENPDVDCSCRTVMVWPRQDGTPDLTAPFIAHDRGCTSDRSDITT